MDAEKMMLKTLSDALALEIDKKLLNDLITLEFENKYPFLYRKARVDFLLYGKIIPSKEEIFKNYRNKI